MSFSYFVRRLFGGSLARRGVLFGLYFFLFHFRLEAAPQVVGFDRFFADEPSVEGGALLFSELGCVNCHGASVVNVPRKGPSFVNLSKRVERAWLLDFLRDPEAGREGSTMPQMFEGIEDADLQAIVAYLGSLEDTGPFPASPHSNAERGSALYHEKGCVACHTPKSDYRLPGLTEGVPASPYAVSLPDLAAKSSFDSLNHFLKNTALYRPDSRMPHLPLEVQDLRDITAYLIGFQGSDPKTAKVVRPWPKAKPETLARGQELVSTLNCAACHSIPEVKAAPVKALPKTATIHSGCLSTKPIPGLPHYELSEKQRASLARYFEHEGPVEDPQGHLTFAALNCYACHDRDGVGGPLAETHPYFGGDEALGDSGRLAPPLTGIGQKLQPEWMKAVFLGEASRRVRPYLNTVMPSYRPQAAALSEWLAALDAPQEGEAKPKSLVETPADLEAGRTLLGTVGGANCITCHTWEGRASLGIQALDLAKLNERLRPEWFHRYLIDPAAYRPGTLMPSFWPSGQASVPDILDGDTDRQIAAIWSFIKVGEGLPLGFPDRAAGEFELIPGERPILQRTFLEKTGTRAILAGFPGGANLAYDGGRAQPSRLWFGPFFDAYHTWYTRAAPFESPLATEVFDFPKSGAEAGRRFRGYRLDGQGNPSFLFQEGTREIEEHFSGREGALVRTLSWKEGEAPEVTHPEGIEVKATSSAQTLTFIYSRK